MSSETSQAVLADISQSVVEMQKAPEVLTAVPEVDTVVEEADTTVRSPEREIAEDAKQPVQEQSDDINKEDEEGKDKHGGEFVKKPGEFTTEVFKIEIRNLPRYSGYKVR